MLWSNALVSLSPELEALFKLGELGQVLFSESQGFFVLFAYFCGFLCFVLFLRKSNSDHCQACVAVKIPQCEARQSWAQSRVEVAPESPKPGSPAIQKSWPSC